MHRKYLFHDLIKLGLVDYLDAVGAEINHGSFKKASTMARGAVGD